MKPATAEQIEQWTHDVVELARTRLPHDHPRYHRIGGGYLADVRKRAQRSADHLSSRGLLPSRDEIEKRANGGVDIEALRAHRTLVAEVDDMRKTLGDAYKLDTADLAALADALRPIAERVRGALATTEEKKP